MTRSFLHALYAPGFLALSLALLPVALRAAEAPEPAASAAVAPERIDPWKPRFGRVRPIVAVVGENASTELVDFMIPYGILADSGVADVVALAPRDGPIQMRPALRVLPNQTLAGFDDGTPLGADYVIVPAVGESDVRDPELLAWLRAQSAKGATVVSICDGALVVANASLFERHRATGHWATSNLRRKEHPDTRWLRNVRYVADGNVVSSAGVSAAIPTSLALVEAIGGTEVARATAGRLGAAEWGDRHDSDQFGIGASTVFTWLGNRYLKSKEQLVIPVADAVDDIALALSVDAWGRTLRSRVSIRAASDAPVRSSHGLLLLPDTAAVGAAGELPLPDGPSLEALDHALSEIGRRYGTPTKRYVALEMEYAPGYAK
jgi:transcriptional regulator GlxA family with amidase domain